MNQKNKNSFKAGMFLLENLTSGMYNDPLIVYREYIQNAVDAIDLKRNKRGAQVKIDIDPFNKTITIADNGIGIPAELANNVLSSIGSSNKKDNNGLRGFRGIGRLGGLAFCDKAIFQTKALGEKIESIQEWDCKKLRGLLSDNKNSALTLQQLFTKITNFSHENSKRAANSYFKITLKGVESFRNYIFDIQKIKRYLSQVAPVPFDLEQFSFGKEVNIFLKKNVNTYGTYDILLNGQKIGKPYSNEIRTTKYSDHIVGVDTFRITTGSDILAYGWYGKRKNLLGSINRKDGVSGIRVRVGNVLIGDSHLLDGCFRESRFNSYTFGEIHVVSPKLIPNSRRDDFVDNDTKSHFYNAIEREIGLPFSKEIRQRSQQKSEQKSTTLSPQLSLLNGKDKPSTTISHSEQKKAGQATAHNSSNTIIPQIKNICGGCNKVKDIYKIITGQKSNCY